MRVLFRGDVSVSTPAYCSAHTARYDEKLFTSKLKVLMEMTPSSIYKSMYDRTLEKV